MDESEVIRSNEWKQGAVLLPDDLPDERIGPLIADYSDGIFLVLSQDCDVVQRSFQNEPTVELLLARPTGSSVDGNFAFGRNPRKLDFQIGETVFRASCHDRFIIDRKHLAQCFPSKFHPTEPNLIDMVAEWIAKRYTRPAFPDVFNERIGYDSKAIREILKEGGQFFEEVLINCSPRDDDLPAGSSYRIMIWLVMKSSRFENEIERLSAQAVVGKLDEVFNGCSGIEVVDCRLVSESKVTLDHLRIFDPWDFDYLTYRESES